MVFEVGKVPGGIPEKKKSSRDFLKSQMEFSDESQVKLLRNFQVEHV